VLFFGMGLFVESNGLVLSTLTFGAICVAFAVFLMLELGLPYTASSASLRLRSKKRS